MVFIEHRLLYMVFIEHRLLYMVFIEHRLLYMVFIEQTTVYGIYRTQTTVYGIYRTQTTVIYGIYRTQKYCKSCTINTIIWHSNLLTLSVPDEGYSRNMSCALNKIYQYLHLFLKIM
jgi:hypothetical protein